MIRHLRNSQVKIFLVPYALGLLFVILPIFIPPAHILPRPLHFLPYLILGLNALIAKKTNNWRTLQITTLIIAFGSYLYFDSIRANLFFSWQMLGMVDHFVPPWQLTVCIPVLALYALRKPKQNRTIPESVDAGIK